MKMMAAAMLIAVMLAGCGNKNDAQSADSGQATNQGTNQGANGGGGGPNGRGFAADPDQPDRTADFYAKVVKVDGDAIVLQKSTVSPADMPAFGGRGGGQRGGNGQQAGGANGQQGQANGAASNGNDQAGGDAQGTGNAPAAGDAQGNGQGNGGAQQGNGQGGNGGQGRGQGGRFAGGAGGGGFMNQMKFADEQTTLPVNADTKIVTFARGQNGMSTEAVQASDLKAGDIITVWLGADNSTALYIRMQFSAANMGNAANNGNTGNTGKAGNGQ